MFKTAKPMPGSGIGRDGRALTSVANVTEARDAARKMHWCRGALNVIGALLLLPFLLALVLFRPSLLHRAFVEGGCHDVAD